MSLQSFPDIVALLRSVTLQSKFQVGNWVGLTLILAIPLSARFYMGRWELGRRIWVAGQDRRNLQIKVTRTQLPTWWVSLNYVATTSDGNPCSKYFIISIPFLKGKCKNYQNRCRYPWACVVGRKRRGTLVRGGPRGGRPTSWGTTAGCGSPATTSSEIVGIFH